MFATASFNFDEGIGTSSWNAVLALRMRVSMSAIGSVIVTARRPPSPGALRHAGNLARVRHLAQAQAAEAEVAVHRARAAALPAPRVRTHLELRLPHLLLDESLLCHRSPLAVTAEREAERVEQRPTVFVRFGRSHDCDVHAPDRVDPVVVDLGEHELLGETERVVAVSVELFRR